MKHTILSKPSGKTAGALAVLAGGLLLLGSCNSSSKSTSSGSSAGPAGSIVEQPDPSIGSLTFIVDENKRGTASEVKVVGMFWGRLVDVEDSTGALQATDYVVGENIRSGSQYLVTTNPITEKTTVRILHLAGTAAYELAFRGLDQNLTPVQDKGLDPGELPPYSVVPRNACLTVHFDDILDPRFDGGMWHDGKNGNLVSAESGQLATQAVQINVGYPPQQFYEARVIVDYNHGDLADYDGDGLQEFHSTRLIIDYTISPFESQDSEPPLAVNSLGLPASLTVSDANLALRIPTRLNAGAGQTVLLTNPTNHPLAFNSNGSNDNSSVTMDIVRAQRSGGESDVTGDLNNGFLLDEDPPTILGNLGVSLTGAVVPDPVFTDVWVASGLSFDLSACETVPKEGDVLIQQIQNEVKALVLGYTQSGTSIENVILRVIQPAGAEILPGAAQLLSSFDPATDNASCYLRFSPEPGAAPAGSISKNARVFLRFSEPMDPASMMPFDSYTMSRVETDPSATDLIVGAVTSSSDLREFSFVPVLPLDHINGQTETYYLQVAPGTDGPTDFAGNPLQVTLPSIPFTLSASEGTSRTGGLVFRFDTNNELLLSPEEQAGTAAYPELRQGQLLYNLSRGVIQPRPVSRYSVAADRDKPVPSVMTAFAPGVQTPLSPLGSRLQTLWRYCDFGWGATDETNLNVDVEGLAWAPIGGSITSDSYEEFQILLAHSKYLPDESLNPSSGFPNYPNSGLQQTFANNAADVPQVVHPKPSGYQVNPSDAFLAQSGTTMIPYPMNRGVAPEDFLTFTFRDTRRDDFVGGSQGPGVNLLQEILVLGLTDADGNALAPGGVWPGGLVPSVGLPLLMEFRCYPDDDALGLNPFDISLAATSSARPNFRAFATGGYNTSNTPIVRDPDSTLTATGGFNPGSTPPGVGTPGLDNSFYIGQADFVTKLSIVHSIWFETGAPNTVFTPPVVEPTPTLQPDGTQVVFAYRGATDSGLGIGAPDANITTDANTIDFYGEAIEAGVGAPLFLSPAWQDSISDIDGAELFQLRMTFISNPASGMSPEISSLGFAFSYPSN